MRTLEMDHLKNMREYFRSGITKEASWRESQLKGLRRFLVEKENDIFMALMQDLGKHRLEAFRDEIGTLVKTLNLALKCLKDWMSSKKAPLPAIALLSSAEIVHEPLGLVLIISSWNLPFGVSLEPLIGAIAAGNAAVLKPSELSPACSSLLASGIATYLDNKAIKVIQGGPQESDQLLRQKWDKIFFTGSARVGSIVMSAAAKHLTPVTLELGGKCPAVVDSLSSSWDLEVAVKRILVGKYGTCAGQACIAIDYVIVEKRCCSKLVELMKVWIKKMFGDNPQHSNTIARIVNKQHLTRLMKLLDDQKVQESVVYGGSIDEENLFIEPTILVDPPLDAAIMLDEVFGPLLPIITVDKIEDSIEFISSRPKPLALYVFTKNKTLQNRMISETSSGSVTFNDAILQYAADSLPFGGVGGSGFGMYHGKFSFDTFSHQKAIVRRSFLTDFWYRYPPWTANKFQLLEVSYNYDYLGLVLVILGLKRPSKRQIIPC
ncbi:putative aldehyde dehydrogenase (NAD(+)) [Medicago truncatula]|uniref:Aldehyde dehydrogenase n=1 Tax=Medicago truncatula TaxID=3880 RepID=A0A072ULE1_MEDTR|nr:aldehyde dehydrogenase family 3 member F1 [Medicago truncatula]KEH30216.1 NAD-dependent aldehyde dehydrogenase family protein [Medicago truncatula]RHN61052.1 putative aldehyde dehydrogenase (NAD(+)) [Medicago truncatula]